MPVEPWNRVASDKCGYDTQRLTIQYPVRDRRRNQQTQAALAHGRATMISPKPERNARV